MAVPDRENGIKLDQWKGLWEKEFSPWHRLTVDSQLEANFSKAFPKSGGKIFVPLCGASVDIEWLYEKGMTVVGIDISGLALDKLFRESKMKVTKEEICSGDFKGTLYKNEDNRIRLYEGDMFKFHKGVEGDFDGIWDRSALIALEPATWKLYAELMNNISSRSCCYLLQVYNYDLDTFKGPPNAMTECDVKELYDDWIVTLQDTTVNDSYVSEKLKVDIDVHLYILTHK